MELRHLRYFIAVAEELHFSRAAARLHIEQSPLSRAIKSLEDRLGTLLFERTSRGTRLTWAGQVFLEDARRVLLCLEQAKANAKAASSGYRGTLHIALSDSIARSRLTELLARCREEEPEVEIRLSEMPLSKQIMGLRNNLYDAGLALAEEIDEEISATPIWEDPLVLILPARHPLLAYKNVPLEEAVNFPLVLWHPENCAGFSQQLGKMLRSAPSTPVITEQVSTQDLMLTLVAAGYGVGFSTMAHFEVSQYKDVVTRHLAGQQCMLTTYFLQHGSEPSEQLKRFVRRASPGSR